MSDIIVVATGASINKHVDRLKIDARNMETIAWGNAFMYFAEKLELFPDFWWYIDPHASLNGLRWIIKNGITISTTIQIPQPILTESHKRQIEYIGKAGHAKEFNWSKRYPEYLAISTFI